MLFTLKYFHLKAQAPQLPLKPVPWHYSCAGDASPGFPESPDFPDIDATPSCFPPMSFLYSARNEGPMLEEQ